MTNRSHYPRWAHTVVVLGLFTMAAVAPRQGKNPILSGSWKYSEEKSELEALEAADPKLLRARRSGGGRVQPGTSISGGGMGGEGGARPGGGGREAMGPLGLYARPLPQLVISQTDSTITMTDPSGIPRTYHTNGKKEYEPLLGTDTLEITAKWKDGKLTTERKLGSFGHIREVFTLDPESHELIVDVRLTGGQLTQPIELHRVYVTGSGS